MSEGISVTTRDEVIMVLRDQITRVGITDSSVKVLKVAVLAGVTKQVIVGKSKYQVVDWLNKQRRATGPDLWYIYEWVYNGDAGDEPDRFRGIKEVNF